MSDNTNVGKVFNLTGSGGASDSLKIAQGQENAGKFLIVGNDGNVTLQTLETWQGRDY